MHEKRLASYFGHWKATSEPIIAFFTTVKLPAERREFLAWTMGVGFLAFASANLGGLRTMARQRIAARNLLVAMANAQQSKEPKEFHCLVETIDPPGVFAVTAVQLAGDAALMLLIWVRSR